MLATIDEQGRLVIPSDLLQQAGLRPGQEVNVDVQGENISIAPSDSYPRLDLQHGLPVIQSAPDTPPLSIQYVTELIDRMRDGERI